MKINPDDLATGFAATDRTSLSLGLTIREELAARAMQGLMTQTDWTRVCLKSGNIQYDLAKIAIACADALIEELNRESK